jgi:arylsulfatase A-like enzyme
VQASRPNVVFVTIDSARVDHFSLYGYSKATTPFLESAAPDLAVYMNANTPAGWTRPAMTSIFTGLYPEQYGFCEDAYPQRDVPFLSEILQRQGYSVTLLSNNPYVSPSTGFEDGVDRFYFISGAGSLRVLDRRVILRNLPGAVRQYLHRRTAFKVVSKMINDQANLLIRQAASDGRPFFMYIHHDAHHPYLSDRRLLRQFMEPGVPEKEIRQVEEVQRSGNMYWFNADTHAPEERRLHYSILGSMHDASIRRNDSLIADIVETLKVSGLYEKTMMIVTADHGEFLGEHEFVSHGLYPYEEVVRVPLAIKFPSDCPTPGSYDGLVSTIDLGPTILEVAGTHIKEHIPAAQGLSLLGEERHEFVVTQRKNFGKGVEFWQARYPDHSFEKYDYGCLTSFKSPTGKFVWSSKGRHGLFDLVSDPGETRNIYDPADAASAAWLDRAGQWMKEVPHVPTQTPAELEDKIKKHLQGLGYIE